MRSGASGRFWPPSSEGPRCIQASSNAPQGSGVDLPAPVREMGHLYLQQIEHLTEVISRLANRLEAATKTDCELRRLCTVLGIGPVTAGAIGALLPILRPSTVVGTLP